MKIGMYHTTEDRWIKFEGDRMAKPSPYITDASPEAYTQWKAASNEDNKIVLKALATRDINILKEMD